MPKPSSNGMGFADFLEPRSLYRRENMKRFLIVVLFVACIVSTVSAGLISFGVGVNALNTIPTDGESVEIGTFEDWNFGTELRLGVLFLEATVNGRFTGSDQFKGVVTAGTSMSLFD